MGWRVIDLGDLAQQTLPSNWAADRVLPETFFANCGNFVSPLPTDLHLQKSLR
jgi:hypothetical protein